MHRIDTSTAQKDKFGPGKNGFTDGNPQTGTPATDLNASLFDTLQEEICTVIESAGITLDPSKNDQLKTAIAKIISDSEPVISVNKKTGDVILNASDVGALPSSGGDLTGVVRTNSEIQSTSQDNFRFVNDTYGSFWRQDANDLYLMLTNLNDAYGVYNDLRPFQVNLETGITSINGYVPYSPGNKPSPEDISAIKADTCPQAGFVSQNIAAPYFMFQDGTIVGLARSDWVTGSFVTGTGLGAQYAATKSDGRAYADAGCVISGIGDFGSDDGSGDQRPMQYCINGQWFTSMGLGETLQLPAPQNIELLTEYPASITELSNLTLYTPEITIHPDVIHLISEEGYDFYAARNFIEGEYIIGYAPDTGTIRLVSTSAERIWPINMSIVALDEIPDGCSMDGTWIYTNGVISQSTEAVIAKNKSQLRKRLITASGYITMYQSCAVLDVQQDGDADTLNDLYEYVSALRNVDLTQSSPAWPICPTV